MSSNISADVESPKCLLHLFSKWSEPRHILSRDKLRRWLSAKMFVHSLEFSSLGLNDTENKLSNTKPSVDLRMKFLFSCKWSMNFRKWLQKKKKLFCCILCNLITSVLCTHYIKRIFNFLLCFYLFIYLNLNVFRKKYLYTHVKILI